jgi:signal transduction histidine kinase
MNLLQRNSVFWRIAKLLIGVQFLAGFIAVGVTLYFAVTQSFNLVDSSLRQKVENLATEIEGRAHFSSNNSIKLSQALDLDLHERFLDPIYFVNPQGKPLQTILDGDDEPFERFEPFEPSNPHHPPQPPPPPPVPPKALKALLENKMVIEVSPSTLGRGETWAIAPLYAKQDSSSSVSGKLIGAAWIYPLRNTISAEISGAREAFFRALFLVLFLGGLTALLVGSWLTWRLVHPLRQMTSQVEAIGAGHYAERVEYAAKDELGRLAEAINQMAKDVESSVETLKSTDKMRRELITNVGHDLRTPVAAVMGYVEEAERYASQGNSTAAFDCLHHARNQADYLKRLINDLFELSLFDSGQPRLLNEPIPIGELLNEAARVRRHAFEQAGISFKTEYQSGLPIIEGDGLRLLRVLDNLLGNALNYTPEGGVVTLSARKEETNLILEVQDSGEGMTEEEVSHIFERYYRGEDARTRSHKGTGLGLAICKATIEAHHGTLSVSSTKGKGSTFTIRLPI